MTALFTKQVASSILVRIEKYENWTDGPLARDDNGNACDEQDEAACQWCSLGAIYLESELLGVLGSEYRTMRTEIDIACIGMFNVPTIFQLNEEVHDEYVRHNITLEEYEEKRPQAHKRVVELFQAIASGEWE